MAEQLVPTCPACCTRLIREGRLCNNHLCNCTKPGATPSVHDPAKHADYCVTRGAYPAMLPAPEASASEASGSATHTEGDRAPQVTTARRERLPPERASYTKTFRLRYSHKDGSTDVMKFYFTAGLYDDGRVGEVFVRADKVGTLAGGVLDAVAIYLSMLLQTGVPLPEVIGKIKGTRFPPAGFTGDADVPNCTSPLDLLARWLEKRFVADRVLPEA